MTTPTLTPTILSTSTLTGNTVRNPSGEDLGEIKDFMIDPETGRIVYAVLSFGGLFGFGDKLFAVPFDALELDTEQEAFRLDVNKEMLESAPGFDEDNWPTHGDYSFVDQIYTHYGFEPYSAWRGSLRRRPRTGTLENTSLN